MILDFVALAVLASAANPPDTLVWIESVSVRTTVSSEYVLWDPRSAVLETDGSLVLADRRERAVFTFFPDGSLDYTVGGLGTEHPQWRSPGLVQSIGGYVAVTDGALESVTILRGDSVVDVVALSDVLGPVADKFDVLGLSSVGDLVVARSLQAGGSNPGRVLSIATISSNGALSPVGSLHFRLPPARITAQSPSGPLSLSALQPFSTDPLWAIGPTGEELAVLRCADIDCEGGLLEFELLSLSRDQPRVVHRLAVPPAPLSRDEQSELASDLARRGAASSGWAQPLSDLAAELHFPASGVHPRHLVIGSDGSALLGVGHETRWYYLDRQAETPKVVCGVPDDARPVGLDDMGVAFIVRDGATGEPSVRLGRLLGSSETGR